MDAAFYRTVSVWDGVLRERPAKHIISELSFLNKRPDEYMFVCVYACVWTPGCAENKNTFPEYGSIFHPVSLKCSKVVKSDVSGRKIRRNGKEQSKRL